MIILVILSVECSTEDKETVEWDNLKQKGQFADYLKFAFENQESIYFDSACTVLGYSILKNSSIQLQISEIVDTINKRLDLKIKERDLSSLNGVKCRNIFSICIISQDSILVEEEICGILDISQLSKEYIANPHDNPNFAEKREVYIDYFGKVEVPKTYIIIDGDFKRNLSSIKQNWKNYFQAIDQILKAYHELRDNISIRMWKTNFNSLKFEKKSAVSKLYPINFLLYFDSFCARPIIPPPPDSLILEILKIIDD